MLAQSGCSVNPLIPIEAKQYTMNFTIDGEEFNVSKEVKFYYRDVKWGSERGASWMASDGLGEYIGYTSKNLLFIVSPFERTYGVSDYIFSPKILVSDNNIKSEKEENYHFDINDINITARYIHHVLFYEPESETLIEIHSFGTNELSKW